MAKNEFQIATYGVSRFQLTNLDPAEVNKLSKKTYSLFNNDGLLINIERILIEAEHAKAEGREKQHFTTFDRLKKYS